MKNEKEDKATPQINILKKVNHKDVRMSYNLQKKLSNIPRKTLNRRYKRL